MCAYARVSTDSDEQFTSFEAQVDYYKNYIQSKPEWEFVGIYTDEGISGTNTKKREGFNKMIEDAENTYNKNVEIEVQKMRHSRKSARNTKRVNLSSTQQMILTNMRFVMHNFFYNMAVN